MALIASRGIGNAGAIEIHDDGSTVLARIRSSDSATNSGAIPFRIANGGGWSQWFSVGYPSGSPWVTIWSDVIPSSRSIGVQIGDTGTQGFGAGGELWVAVNRTPPATVPSKPGAPTASNILPDRMTLSWKIPSNGGAAIDQMLLRRYPTSNLKATNYVDYPNAGNATSRTVTGLTPGTTYWWVVYAHNSVGYSAQSAALAQATLAGGRVRDAGSWRDATPWLKVGGSWVRVRPYEKQSGSWRALR